MSGITKKYFDEKAASWIDEAYDKGQTIAHTRLNAIVNLIESYMPSSVLDIGCGDGRLLQSLETVTTRVGVDYSNRMIELASSDNSPIQFKKIDLNLDEDLAKLSSIGRYDVVTMMGVIHYLGIPSRSVNAFRGCMHANTKLVISFRNRLLNATPISKYFSSPLNQRNLTRLTDEINMWERVGLEAESLVDLVGSDSSGRILENLIHQEETFNGVTDNYWNPDSFEHWRQFTPLDAVLMFQHSGFVAERIVPLINGAAEHNQAPKAFMSDIANCSSFLVVARLKANAD